MNKMIAVVGPTASGKSGLAVEICKRFGGEVVSCDSMQLYKKMNIGTAKPSDEEMQGIAHHLIDFLEFGRDYSVSDYVMDAEKCCEKLFSRGVLPVFCGGTGLYISSFLSGIEFGEYENNPDIRKELESFLEEKGRDALYEELVEVDKIAADAIDKNNVKRVLRALEVYRTTGVTISEWNRRSKLNAKKKDCLVIGLDYCDRELLYARIDKRVDIMLDMGLVDEARGLYENGLMNFKCASQAIAYKEFVPYFEGADTLENCVETLKKNSRRYAKRQLTWFRRNPEIKWIFRDNLKDGELEKEAFKLVELYLSEESNG